MGPGNQGSPDIWRKLTTWKAEEKNKTQMSNLEKAELTQWGNFKISVNTLPGGSVNVENGFDNFW